ncbi:MAG: putative phage-type endonuclease [Candidatus Eremiobacteraeota bacterium]|nr:putative phage-type endonuclease [Candidatus Eremiobacteraeota bacterium]
MSAAEIETVAASFFPRGYRPIAVDTSKMTRDEWLAQRAKTIGASDISTVLNLNPYKSRMRLFLEMTGQIAPEPSNEAMEIGLAAEPLLSTLYTLRTGRRLRQRKQMLYHPEHRFLHANLDREVIGEKRIVELKMVGYWVAADEFGAPGSDQVPMRQLVQVTQQEGIAGVPIGDIAVLKGGNDFDVYEIPFDRDIWDMIVDAGREFFDRVKRNAPPDPTSPEDVVLLHPRSIPKPIEATDAIALLADDYADAKAEEKASKERAEALKMQLGSFMGDHDTLTYLGTELLTFKSSKEPALFDGKRHNTEQPECHAQYITAGKPKRSMLVKEAGSK